MMMISNSSGIIAVNTMMEDKPAFRAVNSCSPADRKRRMKERHKSR